MRFDRRAFVFKLMKSGMEDGKPYWSYEDVGVFSLVLAVLGPILQLFARLHLLPRSELENPGLGLQFAVIVVLSLVLYLVLKLSHHRPVLRPLGWVWPRTAYLIFAPLLGVLLAAGVALYLRLHDLSTPTMPLAEIVVLGLVLGPFLEESFFRGCLLPVLAHTVGKILAVVLSALLFALVHGPANLAHWASFTGTGVRLSACIGTRPQNVFPYHSGKQASASTPSASPGSGQGRSRAFQLRPASSDLKRPRLLAA